MFGLTDDQLWGKTKNVVDPRYRITPRQILRKVGTEWVRDRLSLDIGVEFSRPGVKTLWINLFHDFMETTKAKIVLIDDCRFPDEAEAIIKDHGGFIILIDDKREQQQVTHASENTDALVEAAMKLNQGTHFANLVNQKQGEFKMLCDLFFVLGTLDNIHKFGL